MRHDPWGTKDSTKKRVLDAIGEGGITFGELGVKVNRSRPVLSDHLKQLAKERMITTQTKGIGKGRRIEYVLTPKGKGEEQMLRDSVASAFQAIKALSSNDPSAKAITELAKLAKDDPTLFERFSRLLTDYTALMASEQTKDWLQRNGQERFRLELEKRLTSRLTDAQSERKVEISDLQILYDVTREIVSAKRKVG